MAGDDSYIITASIRKGFRPIHEAMRDQAYMDAHLSTGSGIGLGWIDRKGNSVDFSYPNWSEYEKKEKAKKENKDKVKKGFRGYKHEKKPWEKQSNKLKENL